MPVDDDDDDAPMPDAGAAVLLVWAMVACGVEAARACGGEEAVIAPRND